LVLVDEKCSALAGDLSDLLFESILDFLTGLFHVALHLVGVALGFELVVARGFPCDLITPFLLYRREGIRPLT
jgi:hypothetical protein